MDPRGLVSPDAGLSKAILANYDVRRAATSTQVTGRQIFDAESMALRKPKLKRTSVKSRLAMLGVE